MRQQAFEKLCKLFFKNVDKEKSGRYPKKELFEERKNQCL